MQREDYHGIPPDVPMRENLPTEENYGAGEREAFDLAGLLEEVVYPATKEDLLDYANDLGSPDEILDMFEQLPDTTYNSPTDVSQALDEVTNEIT